jgi:hypothetical protein
MDTRKLLALTIAVAAAAGYFAGHIMDRQAGNAMPGYADEGIATNADFLRLSRKVDELNARLSALRTTEAGGIRSSTRSGARVADREGPSREDVAATQARIERVFAEEKNNAQWSLASTRLIEQSLSAEKFREFGALPPLSSDIECRSRTCRIRMTYTDSGEATDAGTLLNFELAKQLPYAVAMSRTRADGSIDHFIYATRDRPL